LNVTRAVNVAEAFWRTPEKEVQAGAIVRLANCSDETLTRLMPRVSEPTGFVVVLESTW
jgi:hypothetical protein